MAQKMNTLIPQIKNHSYDQISKIIVNLGSNKSKNNDNPSFQLTRLQNSLLMSIFDTPEKYLSNVEVEYDTRKVRTSSLNSSSTLFLFLIYTMYNRFNCAQK